jgi:hypothetical protein
VHCCKLTAIPRVVLTPLLCTAVLWSLLPPVRAADLEMLPGEFRDETWASEDDRAAEKSLLDTISRIESSQGAYGPDLPEQMLSLGLALQQQQRHLEAVNAFKRGVHLARVNSGLYCAEQIPLLQGEVKSHIALGQYAQADDLQQYLYRVQLRAMESGETRADALVQQANCQFNAHRLGLGWQGPGRLSNMWELYRQAFTDILDTQGDSSPKLLTPLYGMLRTQYLVSEYRAGSIDADSGISSNNFSQDMHRFYNDRSENYDRGRSIIAAIYEIQRKNHGERSEQALDALAQLGDWALWNDKWEESMEADQLLLAELADPDAAQITQDRYFARPVPLPDLAGLRMLPDPVSAEQGNILVEFDVTDRGRVEDLDRLDENEDMDSAAIRLLRTLRETRFRPRFEAGQPVDTERLVRAYDIRQ